MRLLRLPLYPLLVLLLASCGLEDTAGAPDGGAVDAGVQPDGGPDAGRDGGFDGGSDAGTDGGDPAPDEVGIATFNVRMLFDTECQSGDCDYHDFERAFTEAELEARAVELAQGIRVLDADVVLLQEVENEAALDALQAQLADRYPVALVGEQGWPASMDVALLSALPVLHVARHQHERLPLPDGGSTSFTREFLEVHLDAGSRTVVVFVAHFKAKANDDPARRLAEAVAAAEIVAEVAAAWPEALVVLGGDLNDVPGSPPLDALVEDGGLLRVAEELGSEDGTYLYRGSWEAIDHLLLHPEAAGAYAPGTVEVVCDAGLAGLAGSDHCALRADFRLAPPP